MSGLFKAIDIKGYWRYGDFFSNYEKKYSSIRTYPDNCDYFHVDYAVRRNTECLYSGIEDKMGNKIFENDILYYDFINGDMEEFFYRVVKFQNGRFVGMFMTGSSIPKVNELDLFKCLENGYVFKGNIFDSGNEVLR